MKYKQNYYRPGRVYMNSLGSTEVDPGEFTIALINTECQSDDYIYTFLPFTL